ncbi:PREDICTED: probable G-protein coupled receptor AH9.1 [Priapulus caudatus]|uniref:Probable G-protein coupled receptor AH9.1 n=1 Tax=Priapulus caudatus TaxID=37621 RepID=A0ABM1E6R8_PRICU|nr:PREDICTED: probable G-protein coupled receptor AH9.1 [Priapulus caudatus]
MMDSIVMEQTTEQSFFTRAHDADDGSLSLNSSLIRHSLPKEQVRFWVYKVGYTSVITAGLLGNSLNLAVMWRSSRLATLSYFFLRWLAVADFFVVAVILVFNLVKTKAVHRSYAVMWYYAHLNFFLMRSLACSGAFIVTAFTVSRYVSICHPTRCKSVGVVTSRGVYRATTASAFVFSALLHVPHLFETRVVAVVGDDVGRRNDSTIVEYDWEWNDAVQRLAFFSHVYPPVKEVLSKLLPIVLVLVFNLLIIQAHGRYVRKRRSLRTGSYSEVVPTTTKATKATTAARRRRAREEGRLMALLLSASGIFFVCTLPQAFVTVLLRACPSLYETSVAFFVFVHVANLVESLHFAINFYVYSLASADFRQSFREVFAPPCWADKWGKQGDGPQSGASFAASARQTSTRKIPAA